MFAIQCRFYPKRAEVRDYEHLIYSYLGGLRGNGQVVGSDYIVAHKNDHYECVCTVPEEDSLRPGLRDDNAEAAYQRLLAVSSSEPEYASLGALVDADDICICQTPSAYVLFTTLIRTEPPVVCADCGGYVPLHKLPRRMPKEPCCGDYHEIINWESEYRACDTLYMNSGVGESFGWRQMRAPESKLTEEGLAACREMASRTGKPFYYFLITGPERLVKHCPSCGSDWQADEPLGKRFDLVCRKCGFVSIAP